MITPEIFRGVAQVVLRCPETMKSAVRSPPLGRKRLASRNGSVSDASAERRDYKLIFRGEDNEEAGPHFAQNSIKRRGGRDGGLDLYHRQRQIGSRLDGQFDSRNWIHRMRRAGH